MYFKTPGGSESKEHWGQKRREGLSCSEEHSATPFWDVTVPILSALGDQQKTCP